MSRGMFGTLSWVETRLRRDLLAPPVIAGLEAWPADPGDVLVAEIDPDLADTAAFCERYEVPLDVSANCVVISARRAGETRLAACVVLVTTRLDVNNVVRRRLDARKASFAATELAVSETGMEYGGITPIGLPASWPLLVDERVAASARVVVGSGVRRSKLSVPGASLSLLPDAVVVVGLAHPA